MPDPLRALEASLADRYRFEREVGRGGMATVYLVHDVRHGRPLALKVIRRDIAALVGPERFLQEISATASSIPTFSPSSIPAKPSEVVVCHAIRRGRLAARPHGGGAATRDR